MPIPKELLNKILEKHGLDGENRCSIIDPGPKVVSDEIKQVIKQKESEIFSTFSESYIQTSDLDRK